MAEMAGRLAGKVCVMAQEGTPADGQLDRNAAVRGVTTSREGWARLRRLLWQPPRPHGEQPRERVVGPLELFYDLAVVVLVAQAAHRLAGDLTWSGFGQFAAVFTLVWIAWANGSVHNELHGHDDARARSTFLLRILVLAAMGAFIPQALRVWDRERGLYRPLAGTCTASAVACLGLGAARPAPLLLALGLVLLLSIPWGYAVARRLANGTDLPVQ